MPNGISACTRVWQGSHLESMIAGCPSQYNNSFYDYTHPYEKA